jgi:hypothetical protein
VTEILNVSATVPSPNGRRRRAPKLSRSSAASESGVRVCRWCDRGGRIDGDDAITWLSDAPSPADDQREPPIAPLSCVVAAGVADG